MWSLVVLFAGHATSGADASLALVPGRLFTIHGPVTVGDAGFGVVAQLMVSQAALVQLRPLLVQLGLGAVARRFLLGDPGTAL